jgi:hypothetical protein
MSNLDIWQSTTVIFSIGGSLNIILALLVPRRDQGYLDPKQNEARIEVSQPPQTQLATEDLHTQMDMEINVYADNNTIKITDSPAPVPPCVSPCF